MESSPVHLSPQYPLDPFLALFLEDQKITKTRCQEDTHPHHLFACSSTRSHTRSDFPAPVESSRPCRRSASARSPLSCAPVFRREVRRIPIRQRRIRPVGTLRNGSRREGSRVHSRRDTEGTSKTPKSPERWFSVNKTVNR